MRIPYFILLLASIVYFGCETPKTTPVDVESGMDGIYQTFSQAYDQLDADLVSNLYTEDALYLIPDTSVLIGRSVIQPTFERYFEWARDNELSLQIEFNILRREISDAMGVDVGYYKITTTGAATNGISVGKFITLAKKDADGTWRFSIDGYSDAPDHAFGE